MGSLKRTYDACGFCTDDADILDIIPEPAPNAQDMAPDDWDDYARHLARQDELLAAYADCPSLCRAVLGIIHAVSRHGSVTVRRDDYLHVALREAIARAGVTTVDRADVPCPGEDDVQVPF